jgi:TolB-like protein
MKRNIFAAALLLFTITGALFALGGKDNSAILPSTQGSNGILAVLPFTGGVGDESEAIAEILSYNENLMARFNIMPRTSIADAIKKEQRFQMTSGMTNADTIKALGEQLGANYVMAGDITVLGSQRLLVVTIVSIETIQQVAGAYLTYDKIEELPKKIPDMMETLLPLLDVDTSGLKRLAVLKVQLQEDPANRANAAKRDADERDANTLAQILAVYLLQNKHYAIYPRTSDLEKVREEFKTQRSGVTSDKSAAKSGYGVNPEYVLSVVARKLGEKNVFNASIIDLAAGTLVPGGKSEDYGTLSDGISAMNLIAKSLSGGKISDKEQSDHDKLVEDSTSAVERTEAARRAEAARVAAAREAARRSEEERVATARRAEERWASFKRSVWFGVGGYFDMRFIDVFAQSGELRHNHIITTGTDKDGKETKSDNNGQRWLYGGKFGMDFGISYLTIGAYLALAGYGADYIRMGAASNSTGSTGKASGMGVGGDFSIGLSKYNFFNDRHSTFPIGGTLRAGVTLLHFSENPLNVPTMFPYLRLSGHVSGFDFGLKLELPVINEEVTPQFGLDVGFRWAWPMQR